MSVREREREREERERERERQRILPKKYLSSTKRKDKDKEISKRVKSVTNGQSIELDKILRNIQNGLAEKELEKDKKRTGKE